MTTTTTVDVREADPEPGSTNPAAMRRQAALLVFEAMAAHSRANKAYRKADELEYQAALWEKADQADDAREALIGRTAGLEAAVDAAVTAEREADDHVRAARGRLTKARNAEDRADASGELAASEDCAARTAKAEKNLAAAEAALAAAKESRATAEKALAAHQRELSGAAARCREALAAALNPGRAPRKHPNLVALGSADDMTAAERQNLAMILGLAHVAAGSDDKPQRRPSQLAGGPDWRSQLAGADPSRPRAVSDGRATVIIPPAAR